MKRSRIHKVAEAENEAPGAGEAPGGSTPVKTAELFGENSGPNSPMLVEEPAVDVVEVRADLEAKLAKLANSFQAYEHALMRDLRVPNPLLYLGATELQFDVDGWCRQTLYNTEMGTLRLEIPGDQIDALYFTEPTDDVPKGETTLDVEKWRQLLEMSKIYVHSRVSGLGRRELQIENSGKYYDHGCMNADGYIMYNFETVEFRPYDRVNERLPSWTLEMGPSNEAVVMVSMSNSLAAIYTDEGTLRLYTLSGCCLANQFQVPSVFNTMSSLDNMICVVSADYLPPNVCEESDRPQRMVKTKFRSKKALDVQHSYNAQTKGVAQRLKFLVIDGGEDGDVSVNCLPSDLYLAAGSTLSWVGLTDAPQRAPFVVVNHRKVYMLNHQFPLWSCVAIDAAYPAGSVVFRCGESGLLVGDELQRITIPLQLPLMLPPAVKRLSSKYPLTLKNRIAHMNGEGGFNPPTQSFYEEEVIRLRSAISIQNEENPAAVVNLKTRLEVALVKAAVIAIQNRDFCAARYYVGQLQNERSLDALRRCGANDRSIQEALELRAAALAAKRVAQPAPPQTVQNDDVSVPPAQPPCTVNEASSLTDLISSSLLMRDSKKRRVTP